MTRNSRPHVMLSSTCYDLAQVRTDLGDFLQGQMGYTCLASELSSFPVDPNADAVENCLRTVRDEADILVLVIGARSGHVVEGEGKTITNLEYLAARAKGIPIYAFAQRDVIALLPIWKKNHEADFSGQVQDARVFEFLETVQGEHKVWTQPFLSAQDIITGLRGRFAYLTSAGISWSTATRKTEIPEHVSRRLGARAMKLALERDENWSVRLFFEVLQTRLDELEGMRSDLELDLYFGQTEYLEADEFPGWCSQRAHELGEMTSGISRLFNEHLKNIIEAGVPAQIIYAAEKVSEVYRECLLWSRRVSVCRSDDLWEGVRKALAKMPHNVIRSIKAWTERCSKTLEHAHQFGSEEPLEFTLELDIDPVVYADYEREFAAAERAYGL